MPRSFHIGSIVLQMMYYSKASLVALEVWMTSAGVGETGAEGPHDRNPIPVCPGPAKPRSGLHSHSSELFGRGSG